MSETPSGFVTDLDTIEFDQLVEIGRAQIPRYAPDWTDHNLHDPGMTLVDLLAWIVDQQIYRTGFVGGRHREAFAALLGSRPSGPRAARGLVWPGRAIPEGRLVEEGTEVRCDAYPTLRFVLDRQVYLTAAAPVRAHVTVDGTEVPAQPSDLDGATWVLPDRTPAPTALTLGLDGPLGRPGAAAPVALGFDVVPPPGPPPSPDGRPCGPVVFEYRPGGEGPWTRLRAAHDGTAGMAATGAVVLEVPPAGPGRPGGSGGSELRLSFDRGFFPVPPHVRAVALNVLPVVQLERVAAASFPRAGTGLPDQAVELVTTDLVPPPGLGDGPVLEVEVGGERWQERADLTRSGPDDPHYVVLPDQIRFGNGVDGRCPPLGAAIAHTGLARTAGAGGNLRAGLSWTVPALDAAGARYGVNRHPLADGRDATPATELVGRARQAATTRAALLTDEELVAAAHELPGMAVGRAEALARFDRRVPDRPVDGVRTLVVVPHGFDPAARHAAGRAEVPVAYLREVAARLGHRRVLGERLVVQGPAVVLVDLWVVVTTQSWAVTGEVVAAVETAVRDRLAAVRRSGAVEPWPLGRDLTVSELVSLVANVDGVATVPSVRVATGGATPGEGPVQVPPDGLVVARDIEITTDAGDRPARPRRGWD